MARPATLSEIEMSYAPPIVSEFTIVIDSREQLPYPFTGLMADARQKYKVILVPTEVKTLKTGDYSLRGYEDEVCVERKSKADLFTTLSRRRDAFEDEHRRMARMKVAAVVVEADWREILTAPPPGSALPPANIYRTVISWMARYRVPWFLCGDTGIPGLGARRFAEITTFRILEKFYKHFGEERGY